MLTSTEENHIKAIFKISEMSHKKVSTNSLAKQLGTKAASVTDMLQKLSAKGLIHYQKYKGVSLTDKGIKHATALIRKHRLWEVFLVDKLRFEWDKIHDIAEHLEHIPSDELIDRLDAFLDYPKFDPHGDPIPNADGRFTLRSQTPLSEMHKGLSGILVGVKEQSKEFFDYLKKMNIKLGTHFSIIDQYHYDQSQKVLIGGKKETMITFKVSKNLLIKIT